MRRQMDDWEQHINGRGQQQQTASMPAQLQQQHDGELPPPSYAQATLQSTATPISERTDHQAIAIPPPAYKDHRQDTRVR